MSTAVDNLEIDLSALQKPAGANFSFAGELSQEEFAALSTDVKGVQPSALKSIRSIHHNVARLLATGMKAIDVSAHTGMSNTRISILLNDVAFKELIKHYQEREDERFVDVQERAVQLGLSAAEVLQERIEDDPDSMSNNSLLEVMKASLDRGGHSPVSRSAHVSAHLGPEDLKAIRENANAKEKGKIFSPSERVIEGTIVSEPVSPEDKTS